jgi:hypothetical protein
MKKIIARISAATLMLCTIVVFSSAGKAGTPIQASMGQYQNTNLKIALQLPDEWQSKVTIEESDNQVVFKYSNPGGQPVFLLAINRVTEAQWMDIKDQLTNSKLLSHKNGMIIYVEITDQAKIKGANSKEFAGIVSKLNDVVQSYKDV